jgi:hypothetical protein
MPVNVNPVAAPSPASGNLLHLEAKIQDPHHTQFRFLLAGDTFLLEAEALS